MAATASAPRFWNTLKVGPLDSVEGPGKGRAVSLGGRRGSTGVQAARLRVLVLSGNDSISNFNETHCISPPTE